MASTNAHFLTEAKDQDEGLFLNDLLVRKGPLLLGLLATLTLGACNSVPKPESQTRDVVFEGQLIGQLTLTENYKAQVIALDYRTSSLVDQTYPWLAAYQFEASCQTLAGQPWQITQPANQSSGLSHPATACQAGSFSYDVHFDS